MQDMLAEPWLARSIDDFVESLPWALRQSPDGLDVTTEGAVQVGDVFTRLETAYGYRCLTPKRSVIVRLPGSCPALSHLGLRS